MQQSLNPTGTQIASSDDVGQSLLVVAHLASPRHVVLRWLSTWPCQLACHNLLVGLGRRYVSPVYSLLAGCVRSYIIIIIIIVVVAVIIIISIIIIIIIIVFF